METLMGSMYTSNIYIFVNCSFVEQLNVLTYRFMETAGRIAMLDAEEDITCMLVDIAQENT